MKDKTNSNFFKVKCGDCGNEQVVFGATATRVKCLVCEKTLANSTGGKTKFVAEVLTVLDKNI